MSLFSNLLFTFQCLQCQRRRYSNICCRDTKLLMKAASAADFLSDVVSLNLELLWYCDKVVSVLQITEQ